MRGGTEAIDAQAPAVARLLEASPADQPRAQERRQRHRIGGSIELESEMLIGNDMAGEAAIARIAGEERLVTQVFGAGAAIGTMSASVPQPWNAYSLPEPGSRHALTDKIDDADDS